MPKNSLQQVRVGAFAAALFSAAVGGCGGSSDQLTPPTSAPIPSPAPNPTPPPSPAPAPSGPAVTQQFTVTLTSSPENILVGISSAVTFEATLPTASSGELLLFEADPASLRPYGGSLCVLRDDGGEQSADVSAGDSVHSCVLQLQENGPKTKAYVVLRSIGSTYEQGGKHSITAVNELGDESIAAIQDIQTRAVAMWNANAGTMGQGEPALQATASQLRTLSGVRDAGVSAGARSLWIDYSSGARGVLLLASPGTKGGLASSRASPLAEPQSTRLPLGNDKVLVWDPFDDQFPTEGASYFAKFGALSGKLPFQVDRLRNGSADIASVATFQRYGTVLISSHGDLSGSTEIILSRELVSVERLKALAKDIALKHIHVVDLCNFSTAPCTPQSVFAFAPSFVSARINSFPKPATHIYASSCQSAANGGLARAFLRAGATSYIGFSDVVNAPFAQSIGESLIECMTGGDALKSVDACQSGLPTKRDPVSPFAQLRFLTMRDGGSASYVVAQQVMPTGTWLRTDPEWDKGVTSPTALGLNSLRLSEGDIVDLKQLGDISVSLLVPPFTDDVYVQVLGAFSSGSRLLPTTAAPVVSLETCVNKLPTDIPEDFLVPFETWTRVHVPAGATSLLFGPHDCRFEDNRDPDNDYRVLLRKIQ